MNVLCTKIVAEQIKDFKSDRLVEDDIFGWSLHKIIANRRATLLFMHNQSKICLVLCNVKKKDFNRLNDILKDVICGAMMDSLIKPEIIERYLDALGDVHTSKLTDRSLIASINRNSQNLKYGLANVLVPDQILQLDVMRLLNYDLVKISKSDYDYPAQRFVKCFKDYYREEVISIKAFTYKCSLNLGKHKTTRTFTIPAGFTFRNLHQTIQVAFGWTNSHLYQFRIKRNHSVPSATIVSIYEEPLINQEVLIDFMTPIGLFVKADSIDYIYDLGDNWEHTLELIEIVDDYPFNYPQCIDGEGKTPPENVGGIGGYEHFKEIMAHPENPEYDELSIWASYAYEHVFDKHFINSTLIYRVNNDDYLYEIES